MRKTPWLKVACEIKKSIEVDWESEFFVCPTCEEPIYSDDYPDIETWEKNRYVCPVCGFELLY